MYVCTEIIFIKNMYASTYVSYNVMTKFLQNYFLIYLILIWT